jgi:hypothetical protein
VLRADGNRFHSLACLTGLEGLQTLSLSCNLISITGPLPAGCFPHLAFLDLSYNCLTATCFQHLRGLRGLRTLDLSGGFLAQMQKALWEMKTCSLPSKNVLCCHDRHLAAGALICLCRCHTLLSVSRVLSARNLSNIFVQHSKQGKHGLGLTGNDLSGLAQRNREDTNQPAFAALHSLMLNQCCLHEMHLHFLSPFASLRSLSLADNCISELSWTSRHMSADDCGVSIHCPFPNLKVSILRVCPGE